MAAKLKKKRVTYTKEVMLKALEAVKSGTPINTASKLYSIPRSSLHSKVTNKYKKDKTGPDTVLSKDEEDNLVQWILKMCEIGCPVTKEHLLNSVAILVKNLKKETPFLDGRPGRHWYKGFLRRHPELSARISESVSFSRALVSEATIKKWFEEVGIYLRKKGLKNIESARIFNTDETVLSLNPKGSSVLAARGSKNVYSISGNNDKENVTALVTGNAAGQLAPTMILLSYQRVPANIYAKLPKDFHIGTSEKGWMTAMLFYEYIANKFYPWVVANNIKLPVILYLDGHVSHLTQPLSQFCHSHKIILIVLPPKTTHLMQPMDVAMFGPLKTHWKKNVNTYRIQNEILSVTKKDFSPLLKKVFDGMDLLKILSNGFRVCGLYPFSVENVDFSKLFIRSTTSTSESPEISESITKIAFIQQFESFITQSTLEVFKAHNKEDEWIGRIEDTSLYYVWSRIVNNNITSVECKSEPNL